MTTNALRVLVVVVLNNNKYANALNCSQRTNPKRIKRATSSSLNFLPISVTANGTINSAGTKYWGEPTLKNKMNTN